MTVDSYSQRIDESYDVADDVDELIEAAEFFSRQNLSTWIESLTACECRNFYRSKCSVFGLGSFLQLTFL